MSILLYIVIFSLASGVLSLLGGVILLGRPNWVKDFSIHFVSFAAGTLLATSFLDILPEALEKNAPVAQVLWAILLGILVLFLVERLVLRFHTHSLEEGQKHSHPTPYLLNVGDGLHNFVDGVVVASAVLVDVRLGLLTALAVAAHELPQEISDFSVMLHHGWSRAKVFWSNLGVSLTNLAGALVAYAAREAIEPHLPLILGFTAGIFIYIATSDLFPELSPETTRDKTSHVLALLFLGIAIVWVLGRVLE